MSNILKLNVNHLSPYDVDRLKTSLRWFGFIVCQEGSFSETSDPKIIVSTSVNQSGLIKVRSDK